MFNYFGDFTGSEDFLNEFLTSLELSLASSLWSNILSIAAYVLMAVGMYTIAKRRGIRHAWLAWIPFGSTWLLGCISDQYRYVVKGQTKAKRRSMLGLEIATSAVGVVAVVILFVALIKMFSMMGSDVSMGAGYDTVVLLPMLISLLLCLVMLGLSIALVVQRYMAMFDLFRSCNPDTALVFLLLSIFLGNILGSVFVFVGRNKDQGMANPWNNAAAVAPPMFQPPQNPGPENWQN